MVHWNLEGIARLDELLEYLDQSKFQILCLCETWHTVKPAVHSSLASSFRIVDSVAIRERSRGRASGGLIIYYSKAFTAQVLDASPWWIICLFRLSSLSFILCLTYFKPSLNIDDILDVFHIVLREIRENHCGTPIIVCGDFNARVGSLSDSFSEILFRSTLHKCHKSLDLTCNGRGSKLLEFMNANSLLLLNGMTSSDHPARFTYCSTNGNSVIDLFWCSVGDLPLVSDLAVLDSFPCSSSHFPVQLRLFCPSRERESNSRRSAAPYVSLKWDYNKQLLYSTAMAFNPGVSYLNLNIQECFHNLLDSIETTAFSLGMFRMQGPAKSRTPRKPWFDSDLGRLKRTVSS